MSFRYSGFRPRRFGSGVTDSAELLWANGLNCGLPSSSNPMSWVMRPSAVASWP